MIRRLAVGGMGEIFLARQAIAGVNRLVVLKRLLPGMAEDAQLVAMFIDEARITANLAHPGIVQVHEFGEDAQGSFIVMEYVAGHHLGQVIARAAREHRPVPVRLGAYIVHEVARALDHAHHARDTDGAPLEIVHRDISPSNVLVSFRGDVKLMDFGVARASNRGRRTNDGSIRGKFAYMAPEQIESAPVDARADVFAAGIVLWELTLGRRLFDGASDFETIRAALEQPIPLPSSIDPYYPPALEVLVTSALERVRDRRLASAAELAAGLKAYLRANPTDRDELAAFMTELFPGDAAEAGELDAQTRERKAEPPTVILPADPGADAIAAPAPATREPTRRRRASGILLALLVLAVGATGTWLLLRRDGPPPRTVAVAPALDARRDGVVDAGTLEPSRDAAPIDAVVETVTIDAASSTSEPGPRNGGSRPDARTTTHRPTAPDPDARPTSPRPDAAAALGAFSFRTSEDGPVFLAGDGCTTRSVPARCKGLVVGTTHVFTFSVPGSAEFTASRRVAPGLTRCEVIPSRRALRCDGD